MRIHCLQHVEFEGPGSILHWTMAQGHALTFTRFFAGDKLPDLAAFDWLLVMGGPMNVHDEREHAWLADEKKFIRAAVDAQKTVIGICLGAQLLAVVLGAEVTKNAHKEIGWYPVQWTAEARASRLLGFLPDHSDVFHWHGDTFSTPPGAIKIAFSEGCGNQGFLMGESVLGLQFHLEVTHASAKDLVKHGAAELVKGKYIQDASALMMNELRFEALNRIMAQILNGLAGQQ